MKIKKFTSTLACSIFVASMFACWAGCTSEPAKTEIDETKNTKPVLVEDEKGEKSIPAAQPQQTSAEF